jgi:hypothetical protein
MGNSGIAAYRQVTENANESKSIIKVLGLVKSNNLGYWQKAE